MRKILRAIETYMSQNELPSVPARLVVGVSGGADSVFLLRILMSMGYDCIACHCNFHLRGEESNRDELFVRSLCQKLGTTLRCTGFDTMTYAESRRIGIEQAARELRYDYFENILRETGAVAVAVAHHRDDNVETLLWNMARGTGIRGLRGMLPRNGNIIRPLLCVSRNDILRCLSGMGQDFVVDSTNLEDEVTRNKIRLNIVPRLRELNPQATANISRMMENMQEVWHIYTGFIDDAIRRCVSEHDGKTIINLNALDDCPSVSTVLFEILSPSGFNRHQIEGMLKAGSGKTFTSATLQGAVIHEARMKCDKNGRRIIVSRTV